VSEAGGSGVVTGAHTYAAAGKYVITVTVVDDDGGTGQATYQTVMVYQPGAGFVNGGGSIGVPTGVCFLSPRCNNRAGTGNLGIDSQYVDPNQPPVGSTQFTFAEGGLDFYATQYDTLIVVYDWAQYRGSGAINGIAGYTFAVTAFDADLNLADDQFVDRFGITIWDAAGNVIFDTGLAAGSDAWGMLPMLNGNLTIHL
jgi:hypothetical protein